MFPSLTTNDIINTFQPNRKDNLYKVNKKMVASNIFVNELQREAAHAIKSTWHESDNKFIERLRMSPCSFTSGVQAGAILHGRVYSIHQMWKINYGYHSILKFSTM
jgi:hypothetical protein